MTTRSKDTNNTIAFQGVPGAYSHAACQAVHPAMTPMPCSTFDEALSSVRDGAAAMAMIPIENSLGGRVADIHRLLPDSRLYIVGEHFQPIQHRLLAPEGATLDSIKIVHSHVEALAQCRALIRELKLEARVHADTAGSAQEVAEKGDTSQACIASALAGEIYGLQVLRDRVEDRLGNVTRFVVMARRRKDPDPASGPCMTSFVFEVLSRPAALYKSLAGFATNGVNVTKLESYILDSSFRAARFFADIEGHPEDVPVARAFEELHFFSSKLKILGVYPAHPYRYEHTL